MITWIAANAATIIVSVIVLILVILAGRSVYKNKGTCSCGGSGKSCGKGCRCCHDNAPKHDDIV